MVKCQICEKECKNINGIAKHIKTHDVVSKEYYDKYLKKEHDGICLMHEQIPSCKKYTKFIGLAAGYYDHCSLKCATLDPKVQAKYKKTFQEKYGVNNPSKLDSVKRKKEYTYSEKYGYKNPFQDPKIKEKSKDTCIKKYGKNHYSKTDEYKKRIKNTCQKKYEKEYYIQTDTFKEKYKKTCLLRYGKENVSQVKKFKEKYKKTCLLRYGKENVSQVKKFRCKAIKTCKERYGNEYPIRLDHFKRKAIKTCKERYGDEYPTKLDEFKKKTRKTYYEKTGYYNPFQNPKVKKNIRIMKRKRFLSCFEKSLEENNLELLDEYKRAHAIYTWKCLKCNCIFKQRWNDIQQGYKCPYCYPRNHGYSLQEKELCDWIKSLDLVIIENSFQIINPKQIDIYIPSLRIAIEYNGLYYHSEEFGYNQNYHIEKTLKCQDQDIQLIHIFEDEWVLRKDQIKKLLGKILIDNYDLLDNNCDMITLNRMYSKNPKYYKKLGYEVKIIEPRFKLNHRGFKVWDVGYLQLKMLKHF